MSEQSEKTQKGYSQMSRLTMVCVSRQSHRGSVSLLDSVAFRTANGRLLGLEGQKVVGRGDEITSKSNQFRLSHSDCLAMPDSYYMNKYANSNWLNPMYMHSGQESGGGRCVGQEREYLCSMNVESQERLLLDDLLNVLMGLEGSYIRRRPTTEMNRNIMHSYEIDRCEDSLQQMTGKLLRLAEYNDMLTLYSSLNQRLSAPLVMQSVS